MKLLEKHFDIALETPDGVTKLRELILKLAMQGKLVSQNSKDQSADILIKEIEIERNKLVNKGLIRKQEIKTPPKESDAQYQLPKGWIWARLNDYGAWKSGSTPSRNNSSFYGGSIPWVKSGEVKQGKISETSETITEFALEKCSLNLNPIGSILIAMYGANIGEVGILEIDATTNQAVCACQTYSGIYNLFLFNLLHSLKSKFISQGAGAAQPNISKEKIINTIVPLPPFEEQKRIVTKIDELMRLCDNLEMVRDSRKHLQVEMHKSAIYNLLNAKDNKSFIDSWNFISNRFNTLYSIVENTADFKKVILHLAMMGKLVPQNPRDQPANELIKSIELERNLLIKKGKLKKEKQLPLIKDEDIPYELPESWTWARLGKVSKQITDGEHLTPPRISEGYKLLSAKNVRDGYIDYDNCDYISKEIYEKSIKRCKPEVGDLLIVSVGGTIGRVSLVKEKEEFALVRSVALIKPFSSLKSEYLRLVMNSPLMQNIIHSKSRGAAQPCLYLSEIEQFTFPIPPLNEQERIINKVDQLMHFCDSLEQQIKDSTNKQTEILNAVLAQI